MVEYNRTESLQECPIITKTIQEFLRPWFKAIHPIIIPSHSHGATFISDYVFQTSELEPLKICVDRLKLFGKIIHFLEIFPYLLEFSGSYGTFINSVSSTKIVEQVDHWKACLALQDLLKPLDQVVFN